MGHTLKLVLLEPGSSALTVDELRSHVGERLGRAPQVTRKVEFPSRRREMPRWVDDPNFEIDAHVRGHPITAGGDTGELNEIVGELMSERLDHERPLWRMDLISPLADGGSAIAFFIHHSMADGITALRLGAELLWDEDPAEVEKRTTATGKAAKAPPPDAPRHQHKASALARLPRTLARELRPGSDDARLDQHIGSRRAVAFADEPLKRIKEIAHGAGELLDCHVTVNDVVVAAVAGGLRAWLGAGARKEHLRAQIPVSLHARSERPDELGNHDSFLFVDLPVSEPDPLRRLALVNAETRDRKQRDDADELYTLFHALGRLGAIGRAGAGLASGPRSFSLSISNVPGPRNPIRVGGRRVRRLHTLSEPADRHALRLAVISCADEITFGLCVDPDALEGVDELAASIGAAVAELKGSVN